MGRFGKAGKVRFDKVAQGTAGYGPAQTTEYRFMAKQKEEAAVQLTEVQRRVIRFNIVGTTPFVANRMSEKVKMGLLLPRRGKMSTADKAVNLKHDPTTEFRNSIYTLSAGPTLAAIPAVAFKRAIANAALDIPGARKSQVGRLSWVEGRDLPLYGIPELFMAVTRQAGIDRTPDIRTRAIFPKWATTFEMSFIDPLINPTILANLLGAAGLIVGVGDGRQEKGVLNYGQFRFCGDEDPEFKDIVASGGRKVQVQALVDCICHDDETERLYDWFKEETARRGLKVVA